VSRKSIVAQGLRLYETQALGTEVDGGAGCRAPRVPRRNRRPAPSELAGARTRRGEDFVSAATRRAHERLALNVPWCAGRAR